MAAVPASAAPAERVFLTGQRERIVYGLAELERGGRHRSPGDRWSTGPSGRDPPGRAQPAVLIDTRHDICRNRRDRPDR